MLHLRVVCASSVSASVFAFLESEPGVAHLVVTHGVSRRPVGDVIEAAVAREVAEDVLRRLTELGVPRQGAMSLQPIDAMVSDTADAAERAAPGRGADAVIWEELVATTGEESQLNPVFLGFLTIACLLAAVGVITDSAITLVGAMVVSPDFGPLAALAVSVVGRRGRLGARAGLALCVGFPLAMLVTAALALLARAGGIFEPGDLSGLRQAAFIYEVGPYSIVLALLAGAAGMVALTSEKPGALIGVFISVTTVPAAGFAALATVAGYWSRFGEAAIQLLINLAGVALAGTLTLLVRRRHIVPGAHTATDWLRHAPKRHAR
ncbi:DUF389 domain-containing protein [Streptomyces oceani]|uniref:DUF389 domain-containing protein n=1 Tax=Streptomyces oceani TaxID=1075402 RepID=A0A1E7KK45_9ACTN|nr:DUF389 domain-containing protein [Streptomyces oceani]OEV04246.1 hypothetical protein AN216_08575 [Streptomyces oceani]